MKLLLFKGRGIISNLIRWQTRSCWSHAAIYFESTREIFEAREFIGVRNVHYRADELDPHDAFTITVPHNPVAAREWLQKQVGKRYDYGSVWRFITREQEDRTDSGKFFCSELAFIACQKAGVNLLERVEPWACSPGLLSLSPLLHLENLSALPAQMDTPAQGAISREGA